MLKPKCLSRGDNIAIISPSSEIASYPRRLQRGIDALSQMGFIVQLAPNLFEKDGHRAGTPSQRADDLMSMFADDSVAGIMCSTGGWNSNDILNLLDYSFIKSHPKVFIGFSDITALHCAMISQVGMVSFHGPTVLPTLGEYGGPFSFTVNCFLKAICSSQPLDYLPDPAEYTEEFLLWEQEDCRPRKCVSCNGPKCVREGCAEGIIIGGNLDTLITIAGTRFCPDFSGAILLLEEEGGNTAKTERDLQSLYLSGVLDKIVGVVYARQYRYTTTSNQRTLFRILSDLAYKLNIPVMMDMAFGHTNPIITIPFGVNAFLDTRRCTLKIIEGAVLDKDK